jgi:hypothetical protein
VLEAQDTNACVKHVADPVCLKTLKLNKVEYILLLFIALGQIGSTILLRGFSRLNTEFVVYLVSLNILSATISNGKLFSSQSRFDSHSPSMNT